MILAEEYSKLKVVNLETKEVVAEITEDSDEPVKTATSYEVQLTPKY